MLRDPPLARVVPLALLVALGACAARLAPTRSALDTHLRPPPANAPTSPESYRAARAAYDALPPDHSARLASRQRLAGYLVDRARRQLASAQPTAAFDTFVEAATLYDPAEIYAGAPRDAALLALARDLARTFARRGDVERVLTALAVQTGLHPADAGALREFDIVTAWAEQSETSGFGPALRGLRALELTEQIARVWPSRTIVERLCRLYLERAPELQRLAPLALLRQHAELGWALLRPTGYSVARIFLLVGRPDEIERRLRGQALSPGDQALLRLLVAARAADAAATRTLELAAVFEDADPALALRLCREGSQRFPADAALVACVGRLATATDNLLLSIAAFETAVRLAPASRSYAERLATQYQQELFRAIESDQLSAAERSLPRITAFYRQAALRFGKPLQPSLARVNFALGLGHYNAGAVERATAALQQALAQDPRPEVLVQLAQIAIKEGRGALARGYLARAATLPRTAPAAQLYWRARAAGLEGRAWAVEGRADLGRRAHERALQAWDQCLAFALQPEIEAEALIHRAGSAFAIDRRLEATINLERAIDAAPERKESYADALSLLSTYGQLPEALDAFHRALGRPEVTEYLKAYCSFWVIGMARRAGLPPDALALTYLRQLRGQEWYHRLAQLVLGNTTFAALRREADTQGRLAELFFYEADRLLALGQLEQARALWRQVTGSRMMAFFEYDMASFNLRYGPATVTTRPLERD